MAEPLTKSCMQLGLNLVFLHAGRLNVLANVVRKPLRQIFSEFAGVTPESEGGEWSGTGDVKYHLGTSYDRPTTSGKRVHLSLLANPSHLEVRLRFTVGELCEIPVCFARNGTELSWGRREHKQARTRGGSKVELQWCPRIVKLCQGVYQLPGLVRPSKPLPLLPGSCELGPKPAIYLIHASESNSTVGVGACSSGARLPSRYVRLRMIILSS